MARRIDTQAVIDSVRLEEQASDPSTPASGFGSVYAKTDGLYFMGDDGVAHGPLNGPSPINFIIDGGGSAIATGVQGDVVIPMDLTITGVYVLADQVGSIVVDLWVDVYANFPPTDADSITASAPPTLSAAAASYDGTLTGWTVAISAGDTLRYNVDSASTVERVTVCLVVERR